MTETPTGAPSVTQEMIDLYDDYTHVSLDRRGFLDALTRIAGGTAAAAAALTVLENNYAHAAIMAENDPRITAEEITFPAASGEMKGYLVRPAGATGPRSGVVVIHENRGLNPHIRDVARRVAAAGFVALAPDFLSPAGGTPADQDQAREMIRALPQGQPDADALAASRFLRGHEATNGKIGAVGFCWGGARANNLAVNDPELLAAVPYYGRQPAAADVPKIKAALLLQYAGLDQRINAGIEEYTSALDAAGVRYRMFIYENANHAFNNDTNEARYDKDAADEAWERTIAFLTQALS